MRAFFYLKYTFTHPLLLTLFTVKESKQTIDELTEEFSKIKVEGKFCQYCYSNLNKNG